MTMADIRALEEKTKEELDKVVLSYLLISYQLVSCVDGHGIFFLVTSYVARNY